MSEKSELLIDNIQLIREVEKRALLYNKNMKYWGNKTKRMQAWHEIAEVLFQDEWADFNNTQRENIVVDVVKRWNNMRSSLIRDLRTHKRALADPTIKHRKYLYHDHLTFLYNFLDSKDLKGMDLSFTRDEDHETQDQSQDEDENGIYHEVDIDEFNQSNDQSPEEFLRRKVPVKAENFDSLSVNLENPLDNIEDVVSNARHDVDQDMNFAMSLVPMFRKLPIQKKLSVQIEILKLFKSVHKDNI